MEEKAAPERIVINNSSGRLPNVRPGIAPMISGAIGRTKIAATIPCSTPASIFSIAASGVGIGARSRSSISFVQPKSCTMAEERMPQRLDDELVRLFFRYLGINE